MGPEQIPVEPADPDVDLRWPARRQGQRRAPLPLLAVISVGGALGACARYGMALLWPTPAGAFPWATLLVNASGCACIGLLMVMVTALDTAHPLARPFLGTGVLGGFTTFSTYALDAERLTADGHAGTALAYLALTMASGLGAVSAATLATRSLLARLARRR
nr:CrcB family protein [Frankia sp. CiP3]